MINEAKEMLVKDANTVVGELLQELQSMDLHTSEACVEFQEKLIDAGEYLERIYGLENTEFIRHMEGICEILYVYSQGEMPAEGTEFLRMEIKKLLHIAANDYSERILSICVILKDEVPYLEEWMEYHLMLGVEHFYIYDNNSTDGLYEFLQYYIERGLVTYIPISEFKQMEAYMDACTSFKYATKYIAFIDADEFLAPVQSDSLVEVLEDIFTQYPYAGGVGVNWRVFGSSFYEDKPEGLIIENYIYRQNGMGSANLSQKFNPADNAHIKTVCNPRRVARCNNPHFFEYMDGAYQISEYGTVFSGPFFAEGRCDKIRLNHYYTKSKREFYERRRKGFGDNYFSEEAINTLWNIYKDAYNECKDETMGRYVKPLKERLRSKCK